MNLPKGIIFDMDGTLVDNIPFHKEAWVNFLEENGVTLTSGEFQAQNHGTLVEMMARFFPNLTDLSLLNTKGQEKEAAYRKLYASHIQEINGLTALLEKLKEAGVTMLLATMGDTDNIDFTLGKLGISKYFGHITGGHEVRKGKPDPEIFQRSLFKAGLAAEDCLVVEDSIGGVKAAVQAGIPVVGITTSHSAEELIDSGCVGAFRDFEEILHEFWKK
jgi:beta-phosphoglucomutase